MQAQQSRNQLLWIAAGIVASAAVTLALVIVFVVGMYLGRRQEASKHVLVNDVSEFLSLIDESKQSLESETADSKQDTSLHPGGSRRIGDFTVKFEKAEFREIETVIGLFGRETVGKAGPFLVLTITFSNHSEGRVVKPYAVIYEAGDNFGNDLGDNQIQLGSLRKARGDEQMEELQPGDTATMIVCLQRKIDTAKSYKIEMAAVIGGGISDRPESVEFTAEFDAPTVE